MLCPVTDLHAAVADVSKPYKTYLSPKLRRMRAEPGLWISLFDPEMPDIKVDGLLSDFYKAGGEGRDASQGIT